MAQCEFCKKTRADTRPESFRKHETFGRSTFSPPEEITVVLCEGCNAKMGDQDSDEYKWLLERIS